MTAALAPTEVTSVDEVLAMIAKGETLPGGWTLDYDRDPIVYRHTLEEDNRRAAEHAGKPTEPSDITVANAKAAGLEPHVTVRGQKVVQAPATTDDGKTGGTAADDGKTKDK